MLIPFDSLTQKYRFQPSGVLHIGANVGEEANAYHNLKVDRVVWIEAHPDIFKRLEANLQKYPNQVALNYCIGNVENKDVVFNVSNNGSQSSSILELGTHKIVHPEVKYINKISMKMKRIDCINNELRYYPAEGSSASVPYFYGLDFLNIDLQGAELLALHGMGDLLDQFKYAYLEVNWKELYKGCALFDEIVQFMKSKGFIFRESKECGHTSWGDAFWMR